MERRQTGSALSHRNSGIDLLKIISMTYVVVLHAMGHGGVLDAVVEGSAAHGAAWLIETWCYCAVDAFALISGYLACNSRSDFKASVNMIVLWLQVVFYALIVLFYCAFVKHLCSFSEYLPSALLPVTHGLYWYFTAYAGMFVFAPILKRGLENLSPGKSAAMLLLLIFAFSVLETVGKGTFKLQNGYSAAWLMILYAIGYLINRSGLGKRVKPIYAFAGIVALCLITWAWKLRGPTGEMLGYTIDRNTLLSYSSPTILLTAVLYLVMLERLRVGPGLARLLRTGANSAFTVYLLNDHPLIRRYYINGRFSSDAARPKVLFIKILLFSVAFFWSGILVDQVRLFIFNRLGLKKRIEKALALFINKASN